MGTAVIGLVINVLSFVAIVAIALFVHSYGKKQLTQQAMNDLTISTKDNDHYLFKKFRGQNPIELNAIAESDKEDNDKTTWSIVYFLNQYESLCSGVLRHLYHESMVKAHRESTILHTYDSFKPFIDDWRTRRASDPTAWTALEAVAKRWRQAP